MKARLDPEDLRIGQPQRQLDQAGGSKDQSRHHRWNDDHPRLSPVTPDKGLQQNGTIRAPALSEVTIWTLKAAMALIA
jgi:hypothetical protein